MVISIARLRAGSDPASYYLSRQASCPADYYLGAERAGRWLGSGPDALGLSGSLDQEGGQALRELLAGRSLDGQQLVGQVLRADGRGRLPARDLVDAVRTRADSEQVPVSQLFPRLAERAAFGRLAAQQDGGHRRDRAPTLDPARAKRIALAAGLDVTEVYRDDDGTDHYAAAKRYAGRRVDVRRPGFDPTVSTPKSVSILFALGDPDVAAEVRAAHHAAVSEVVDYLESVAGHGLRGHQGDGQRAERIRTAGWIVAAFEHRTSRAGDPQLHTHLVLPNLLHGADGKWSAVDSRAIFRHSLTASYLYHAVLRGQLTSRLGVAWTTPEKGVAEIRGVPADLIRTFSTRRQQILRDMEEHGVTGPEAAQAACLATRPVKPTAESEPTLRERWATEARDAGHEPGRVVDAVLGRTPAPEPPSLDQVTRELLGPTGLTAQATGFDRRDLLQALCQHLPTGLDTDRARLERGADNVLADRNTIRLATRSDDGPRWSTAELLAVEQAALEIACELREVPGSSPGLQYSSRRLPPRACPPSSWPLARSLAAANGLAVVVGPAGSGKTAALAAATHAWTDQGRRVTGAAVAAVTARRLEHATGIRSTSLTRLLGTARRTDPVTGRMTGLPPGGIVVVDEASMVDTRTLATLLAHTRTAVGTLVLVGDPAQLPEIGAGGLFTALTRHADTIELTGNHRQSQAWERRALADLRAGDPDAALDAYVRNGRVCTASADQLPDRIVGDYLKLRAAEQPEQSAEPRATDRVVMLAVRRADVTQLNDTTRERLLENGQLGLDAVTAGEGTRQREYRAGDRVLVIANDHHLDLLNGTRAWITAVDARRSTLTVVTEDRQQVTVPAGWAARYLDHGYAMTCHKAQGATVDVALVYGAGGLTREAGYVGLSRGRTANLLYVAERDDRDQFEVGDDLGLVAARLATRRAQTLATRQLPRHAPDLWRRQISHQAQPARIEGIAR